MPSNKNEQGGFFFLEKNKQACLFIKELRVFSKMQRSSKHINILFHYKLESCEMTRLQTSEIMRIMINVELCGIYISIFCIDFHYDSLF